MPIGKGSRRHLVETLVRPTLVVLDPPSFDLRFGFLNGLEPVNIQALVPKRSVERFDEAVIGRLARPIEVDRHLVVVRPQIEDPAGELTIS